MALPEYGSPFWIFQTRDQTQKIGGPPLQLSLTSLDFSPAIQPNQMHCLTSATWIIMVMWKSDNYFTMTKSTALSHIDNTLHFGDWILETQAMVQITIPNVTYLRQRWALNLVLPGIMETLAIVAPWKGFAYHEATWRDLTSALDSTIKKKNGEILTMIGA